MGEVPKELDTVRQMRLSYLRKDAIGGAALGDSMRGVERAVQLMRGQMMACESYPETVKNVDVLQRLAQLEGAMELAALPIKFPMLPPLSVGRSNTLSEKETAASREHATEAFEMAKAEQRKAAQLRFDELGTEYINLSRDLKIHD